MNIPNDLQQFRYIFSDAPYALEYIIRYCNELVQQQRSILAEFDIPATQSEALPQLDKPGVKLENND